MTRTFHDTWSILACAALLLGALAAHAQMRSSPGQFLDKADENHDGAITRAEYQTARVKAFEKLDRNNDGFVDQNDAPKRRRANAGGGGERFAAVKEQLDQDGDGRVSREEFSEAPMVVFDRADADHDGRLNATEIETFKEAMQNVKEARS